MAQYSTTDDTQWNDVLRAKGILTTPQPNDDASSLDRMPTIRGGKSNSSTNITQAEIEALVDAVIAERVAREDEEMPELTDEQLDAMLEADTGASLEDERALDAYRRQRLAEMQRELTTVDACMPLIGKSEYVERVTVASRTKPVVLLLFKEGNSVCDMLSTHLRQIATEFHTAATFLRIIGTDCIPGYPDRNLPTLLVYRAGDLYRRVVGVDMFGGAGRMQLNDVRLFVRSVLDVGGKDDAIGEDDSGDEE